MQHVSLAEEKKQFEEWEIVRSIFTIYEENSRQSKSFWRDLEGQKAWVGQYRLRKMFMMLGYDVWLGVRVTPNYLDGDLCRFTTTSSFLCAGLNQPLCESTKQSGYSLH